MVANGHHWNPRWPEIAGRFAGRLLHSHDFKRADDGWRDQRVLVIGAGNSAADVAVETSRVARRVHLSVRSPQWFVPKYLFGLPADVIAARQRWLPRGLRQRGLTLLLRTLQGSYAKIGLPENTRPVLSQHPTLNSDLLDLIRHGRVVARPGVSRFDGHTVHFTDGTHDDYDIVVAATGFKITFPFFERGFLELEEATEVPLYRKMMHPDVPTLYFIVRGDHGALPEAGRSARAHRRRDRPPALRDGPGASAFDRGGLPPVPRRTAPGVGDGGVRGGG